MHDADKVSVLNNTGIGSTPQEPLALVAKMSGSERSALESERRDRLASAEDPDATPQEIRYRTSIQHSPAFLFITSRLLEKVYYRLYADDYEVPSKVAVDPKKPSLGRIRTDSVAPPYGLASIKLCISRVERTPAFAHADLFANISCDTPLEEGQISILFTDGLGMSPNEPMAIVQIPIFKVQKPLISNVKYIIKNRAADIYWIGDTSVEKVYFCPTTLGAAKASPHMQVSKHSPIIRVFKQ